jgi:hypothetical protein
MPSVKAKLGRTVIVIQAGPGFYLYGFLFVCQKFKTQEIAIIILTYK